MSEDLIWGRRPVLEALRAGEALLDVRLAAGVSTRAGSLAELVEAARRAGVAVRTVPRSALDREARGAAHQGVLARVAGYAYQDLDELLAEAIRRGEPPWLLVLDAVQDVHNLGSLLRTAEAAGLHGVVLADRDAAGVTAAVRKASAGAVAHLRIARMPLAEALDRLRARGVRAVGLDEAGEAAYASADLTGPLALVVGSEGRGLSRAVASRLDARVALPMRGRVASLNAAVAGSIVVYESLRQRASHPSAGEAPEV